MVAISKFENGKIVKVEVEKVNEKSNTFSGTCIVSNCSLNPIGQYATNWDRNNFLFFVESKEIY